MNETALREQICVLGKSIFDRGLTAGSSGNISVRLGDGWLLTPTNASLGRLDPARLTKLDGSGSHVSGDPGSKEAYLHRSVYDVRPKCGAIVHLHSTYSTAVSCMAGLDHESCIPPLTAYFVMKIGRLPLLGYYRPGDPKLGDAIRAVAAKHTAVLLAHHGPIVAGTDLDAAANAAEELEATAKLFMLLQPRGYRTLDEAQIAELRRVFALDD